MSGKPDVVVIGAGHNGLTAATFLARSGRQVLVVERRGQLGGLAAAHEFHPGYRSGGLLHDSSGVSLAVAGALKLERHGLQLRSRRPALLALGDGDGDGDGPLLLHDDGASSLGLAARSPRDATRYAELTEWLERIRPVVRRYRERPPADLVKLEPGDAWSLFRTATTIRRLGAAQTLELLRVPPMCVADWLDEWFESGVLKAALALPAMAFTFAGPRSPGTAANLLLTEAAASPGVVGDGPALVAALERSARAAGVEIRTDAAVERVQVKSDRAVGVVLTDGECLSASDVAAACDPRQLFLRLVDGGQLSSRFYRRVRNVRARATTAHLLLALRGRLRYAAAPDTRVPLSRTGGELQPLERAFDSVKYRELPAAPVLELHLATVETPELAPDGCDVAVVRIHCVPHTPEGGWSDDRRRLLVDRVLSALERHAPGLSAMVEHAELLTPPDIEARYGCSGGHLHHVEHALDQLLVRPTAGCSGYRTPIDGLWLCGSGSHPGGGLSCLPGALAASALLSKRLI